MDRHDPPLLLTGIPILQRLLTGPAWRVFLRGADALSDHFGVFSELMISRVDAGRTSRLEAG
ncbi:MAG TPA: hypothetical protein EYQ27_10640 [Gemmatimonadetes bacterium]|nr:hypothetical protein [Gemmatimonadota bacterium]